MSEQNHQSENDGSNWGFVVVFGILVGGAVAIVYIITNAIVRTAC